MQLWFSEQRERVENPDLAVTLPNKVPRYAVPYRQSEAFRILGVYQVLSEPV